MFGIQLIPVSKGVEFGESKGKVKVHIVDDDGMCISVEITVVFKYHCIYVLLALSHASKHMHTVNNTYTRVIELDPLRES